MRACILLLTAVNGVMGQPPLPHATAAGWDVSTDPACPGGAPCIALTVAGDHFGDTQGSLQKGDFLAPAPPPPAQPWDTPAVLFPADLATRTGGNGVCVARSLYTGDGFAYRFCPFQRVEHFEGGGAIGTLGQYAGVIRDFNNPNCPGANAITGMTFLDGPLCNGVPATSTVTFVCVDVLGAGLATWGTNTPMVNAAARSADGCHVDMTLPLPGACDGARFALCGSAQASPNPVPTSSPSFSYTNAQVTSWRDGLVTALMPGAVPPPAVRVQRASDLAVSTGFEPEGPGPLPPSFSPRPSPFPSALQVISMTPNQGVRGQCTPVLVRCVCVRASLVPPSQGTHAPPPPSCTHAHAHSRNTADPARWRERG